MEDGISQNKITSIIQDYEGYMWFGTDNALYKFNGYEFITYKSEINDTTSLCGRNIKVLFEDKKKRLWIGTGYKGGLHLYNRDNNSFTRYLYFAKDSLTHNYAFADIVEDNKGNLWLGTDIGLCRFNPGKPYETKWYKNEEQNNNIDDGYDITCLNFDSNNNLWIGHRQGLDLFDINTGKRKHFTQNKSNSNTLSNNFIYDIVELSDKTILIGTQNGGLNIITPENLPVTNTASVKFMHIKTDVNKSNTISSNLVYKIIEDKSNIWICTDNGLDQIEKHANRTWNTNDYSIKNYSYDPQNDESLNFNFVRTVYVDRSGVLWVGTNIGLNKSKIYKFQHFNQKNVGEELKSNKVHALYEDENERIWIGTTQGVSFFDRRTGYVSSVPLNEAVVSICGDKQGYLWFGTWDNGLVKYNPKNNQIKKYVKIANSNSKHISYVFNDHEDNIWASVWGTSLVMFDRKKNKFIQYEHYITKNINSIFEDSNNTIWIASLEGLGMLKDKEKGEFICYQAQSKSKNSLQSNYINCITEDDSGILWIGTMKGLHLFNPGTQNFILYSEQDRLPSDEIMGILIDNNNSLWVSTRNGLSKLSFTNNKQHVEIKNYGVEHGLQGREFIANSFHQCKSGEMLFGGINGFNLFNPDYIIDNQSKPNVVLTDFQLFNKHVNPGEKRNENVILPKPISALQNITLSYKDNFFSIWFSALHYLCPNQNKYSYKMEGFDDKWNYIGTERKVTFIGLPPGNYTFLVKASNCDGIWSDNAKRLNIVILPPWWKTITFKFIIVIFLVAAVFMILSIRTYSLKKQKKMLQKRVELKTSQLKEINVILEEKQKVLEQRTQQITDINEDLQKRNNEIEIMAKQLHEADQSKLRFFTNISHEFRTPLSLILAPLEKFMQQKAPVDWQKMKMSNYIPLMYKNTKRLLRLVNQIIDFSKLDQKAHKLNARNNNIFEFINEIADAFRVQAEAKGIQLKVMSEELRVNSVEKSSLSTHQSSLFTQFWFDPDIMEKILYNLISNAIKYTPEGGKISIQLRVKNDELRFVKANIQNKNSSLITHHSSLIIKITDTGIGIKPENLDKIFDRFYRSEEIVGDQSEGAGIGLAYCKELVNFHNGQIKVESKYQKGSTFTLSFPFKSDSELKNEENNSIKSEDTRNKKEKSFHLEYTKLMINEEQSLMNNTFLEPAHNIQNGDNDGESDFKSDKDEILIIEDNRDMQLFIAGELKNRYSIRIANNGFDGFNKAVKEIPDLIISDIMMPRMDGIEMSEKLKNDENTCHIPIILLTAKTGEEEIIKGLKTGVDDYITKPFNIEILKAKIENLLHIRKQLREKFGKSLDIKVEDYSSNSLDRKFLSRAIEIVETNMNDYDFSTDRFIELLGFKRTMAYKKIKSLTNQAVSEFIRNIRFKKAAKLLLEGKTVMEVIMIIGIKYEESFYRTFANIYGKTPSQFIMEHKKNNKMNDE